MAAEPLPAKIYFRVYATLMALLILTVGLSFVDIGRHWNNLIAEGIGFAKAMLIVLFFMHVRYGSKLTWFFAGAGVLWLGMMMVLTSSDYLTRNHPQGINPRGEPTYLLPRAQTDERGVQGEQGSRNRALEIRGQG
jgi:cytochrome c oxidase subunit 4